MRHLLIVLFILPLAACGRDTGETTPAPSDEPAATDVSVRFVRPLDGDTLTSPVGVVMEVHGVHLMPAGEMMEGSGHLHVMVDTTFVEAGQVIPKNEHHLHFGDASTQAEISLAPGEHVLRLQLGDGAHIALEGAEYRDEVRIVVLPDNG